LPNEGRLLVTLRNNDGKCQSPGAGNPAVLNIGSQMEFNPGYVTALGTETSPGPVFWLDGWNTTVPEGKAA